VKRYNASPLLQQPRPDFTELTGIIKGEVMGERIHPVELHIDDEVLAAIQDRWVGEAWIPNQAETRREHFAQKIQLYLGLGYDYYPWAQWPLDWMHHPRASERTGADTALLSRGNRRWVDEGRGLIGGWRDFERFPWDKIEPDWRQLELASSLLPQGMRIVVCTNFFEHVLENLLGFEGLFYKIHDDPGLVAAVFERWGEKVESFYRTALDADSVGALFHADDLGHKTSTLLSPEILDRLVFPWLTRFAALAHGKERTFWLHSCGNHYRAGTLPILLDRVRIDAFHSFEEVITPVSDFISRFGDRAAALGGVDMDRLARSRPEELRRYVRGILAAARGRRYALGSGNTIANYIPLENYITMLEEGRRAL